MLVGEESLGGCRENVCVLLLLLFCLFVVVFCFVFTLTELMY